VISPVFGSILAHGDLGSIISPLSITTVVSIPSLAPLVVLVDPLLFCITLLSV
jgi:hypothetical protein